MRRQSNSGQAQQQLPIQQGGYGQSFGPPGTLAQQPIGVHQQQQQQQQRMAQSVPFYTPVRPGYGYTSGGAQPLYWAPPPGAYHGWPQQMPQRPQMTFIPAPPGQTGVQFVQQPHLIPAHHPAGPIPQSPRRLTLPHQLVQQRQQSQQSQQQQQQQLPQQQQYVRPRFLIPGNGVRSSSIGSTKRGSIGSVRSLPGDEGPELATASAEQQPPARAPQQLPQRSASQTSMQLPQSQPEAASPARVASPIQAPCAHFLKSGTCAFGDRCCPPSCS